MENDAEVWSQSAYMVWARQYLTTIESIEKDTHGDQSEVFHIRTPSQNYILKVAADLRGERDRIEWLQGKLPVPVLTNYAYIENKDVLLMTELAGRNLASLVKEWPPQDVVEKLAVALRTFHHIDMSSCPFGEFGEGRVVIHGDACLPNFIFDGSIFSGYIDLGGMGIGDVEIDLVAAVWSLERNLGPGYGAQLLSVYGYQDCSEEKAEKFRLRYEEARCA